MTLPTSATSKSFYDTQKCIHAHTRLTTHAYTETYIQVLTFTDGHYNDTQKCYHEHRIVKLVKSNVHRENHTFF